ncbi:MAG: hypothetical protein E6K80_02955, partial [Candidatus Eisenbacteria bacterium]
MRTMSHLLRSRVAQLAGSVALGLGLLTLGLLAFGLVGWTPSAGAERHDRHDTDWEDSDRGRVQGAAFHWSGRIAPGRRLEIHGINGPIEATLASGSEARVDAEKYGRRSDPDRVKVDVVEERDGVLICARYPKPNGELNDCDERHGQETRNNDTVVKFHVEVPRGVELVAHTVNGGIEIEDLKGDVEAAT